MIRRMCSHARTRITVRAFSLLLLFSRCFTSVHASLDTSIPNYVDVYKPMDYAVIGQQKSGTSTLWNVLTSNPKIKWVGHGKESFYFSGETPPTTLCDNLVEEFQSQVAVQRLRFNRTDLLIGDWSATHFSCACCPPALKTLNPKLKIVIVLRDPIQRALSRFLEQKRNVKMPYHLEVVNVTFAEFVRAETAAVEACVARAAPLRQAPQQQQQQQGAQGSADSRGGPFAGWGAGLDIGRWMEMQCFARRNILGWSVYDVFLENYLAHFPQEQLLVLYTDELSTRPLESFRRVEAFLGAPPHDYDPAVVSLVFNSRDCYHWRCGRKKGEIAPLSDSSAAVNDGGQQQQQQQQQQDQPQPRDGPFLQAVSQLVELYRPHMQRLFAWADQGRIAPPPPAWRKVYG